MLVVWLTPLGYTLTSRYTRHDKRSKLYGLILCHLHDTHLNTSTNMVVHIASEVILLTCGSYCKRGNSSNFSGKIGESCGNEE
ncbi:putative DNA helicase [Helianthus annuus]|nr:putative DNA helicase [Helianthus annuus]